MPRPVRVRDRMRPGAVAVAWGDSAEAALACMRDAGLDAVPVVNDQRVIGLLERTAVLACERTGNWLGAVLVADLMRRGVARVPGGRRPRARARDHGQLRHPQAPQGPGVAGTASPMDLPLHPDLG